MPCVPDVMCTCPVYQVSAENPPKYSASTNATCSSNIKQINYGLSCTNPTRHVVCNACTHAHTHTRTHTYTHTHGLCHRRQRVNCHCHRWVSRLNSWRQLQQMPQTRCWLRFFDESSPFIIIIILFPAVEQCLKPYLYQLSNWPLWSQLRLITMVSHELHIRSQWNSIVIWWKKNRQMSTAWPTLTPPTWSRHHATQPLPTHICVHRQAG